jgi:hypothetical protein
MSREISLLLSWRSQRLGGLFLQYFFTNDLTLSRMVRFPTSKQCLSSNLNICTEVGNLRESSEICKCDRALGSNHPNTVTIRKNLENLRKQQRENRDNS